MPITYNLNNSPPPTVPNPTNSTPTFGPPNSGLETIRTNPIEFMTTFRSSVLSDIRTIHTNIINSFTAIENNYTKYFDAVSQVLLTRDEYAQVQAIMDPNAGREDNETEIGLLTFPRNTPSPTHSFSPSLNPKRPSPKPNNPPIPVVTSTQSAEITPVTHDNNVQPTIIKQEPIGSLHPTEENPETITKVRNPPITGSTGSDENGLYFSWVDRVAVQRSRNDDLRKQGHSMFPDQLVGFNDDGIP
ncbi:hypothetical protein FB446DRAFT_848871, partial [Lentinula raphanica]